jgi:hypothetical protein
VNGTLLAVSTQKGWFEALPEHPPAAFVGLAAAVVVAVGATVTAGVPDGPVDAAGVSVGADVGDGVGVGVATGVGGAGVGVSWMMIAVGLAAEQPVRAMAKPNATATVIVARMRRLITSDPR